MFSITLGVPFLITVKQNMCSIIPFIFLNIFLAFVPLFDRGWTVDRAGKGKRMGRGVLETGSRLESNPGLPLEGEPHGVQPNC